MRLNFWMLDGVRDARIVRQTYHADFDCLQHRTRPIPFHPLVLPVSYNKCNTDSPHTFFHWNMVLFGANGLNTSTQDVL